ncbi:hypothetical protein ZYGR_0BB01380 [Zygosaccharomyces rouxii]|uniref:Nucleolar protein Dnt1-like N-terminal domain-containing protein n=1 Tax=Zygosaccharomyces rouxii TaxID=4956 RepID=A0A1Q3AKV7_ZYGRO|nr:hypothetical protein ZYGR_0BB01380 [Zygosaccharomyces rouxii]
MFKLQVVLVPPSAQNALLPYGLASSTAESSQLLGVNPLTNSRNPDSTLPYAPSGNASSILPHHFTTRTRKFLHFTKSANTLLELSTEIVEKCNKMYPYVDEIEILSLQDSQGCDLDPDFLVKDIFTMDNVVRAIVRNELEIEDSSPVSSYRAAKRKRLNNGSVQNAMPSGVLNVAKKRPAAFAMRNPSTANNLGVIGSNINSVNNNMRVSTPLAHQIYPPPSDGGQVRMDSNNSEDEDEEQGERSFLPPPAQPQSPPIRVSSGIDQTKKIKSMIEDDTVSRSETVDPDKLRQQRLLSGTPVRPTMTPNRVTLTGQRVVSENQPAHLSNVHSNRKPSSSATRITSGRLSIPEPKISEMEKELREGPSSPSSVLPPKPDRIPMKRPLQETEVQRSEEDDEEEDEESEESEKKVRQFIQRQTSIADNNGSPTKNSPLSEGNVHLAELPRARPSSEQSQFQRKTSLEAKVEHKTASGGNLMDDERLRIDNFSEDEADGAQERERDRQLEGQLDRGNRQFKSDDAGFISPAPTQSVDTDDSDDEAANDTVVVRGTQSKSSGNHSINREELLRFMEGDYSPTWNKQYSKRKPYTTVLHKDIDNSKPDPRNILPEKMTRSAAKKAAQLLAGREDKTSELESEQEIEESSSEDGSSGIEFDGSAEDSDDKVAVAENNLVRTLNIHPLKETVVKTDENDQHNDSERSEGTSFASSSDHEEKDRLAKNDDLQAPKIVVQDLNLQRTNFSAPQSIPTSKELSTKQQEKFSATRSSPQNATLSQFRTQMLNSEKELPKSSPSSLPANNTNGANQRKPAVSPTGREATDAKNHEKSKNAEESERVMENLKNDSEAKQRTLNESKKLKEESDAKKRQEEEKLRVKQQEAEVKKKKQQEELERLKQQQFKRQQEELERKKREFYEKKKQEELERQKREQENRKREEENRRKEAEAEKKRIETLEKQRQEKLKLKQQEELEEKKREEEKTRQQELEKKRQQELEKKENEELEKKRQQEEMVRKKQQEELEKKKKEEELEKKRQQEELAKKKKEEELEKRKKQEELEKRKQEEELEKKRQQEFEKKRQSEELGRKKKQEELEKKRKEKEDQERKRREEVEKKKQEELQTKRQAEVDKKREEELQKKKQAELDKKKQQDAKKAKSSAKSTISKPASAKSPAVTNGSDKLKELKARFTSPKAYVPTPAKSSQQANKDSENEESESSEDESSTEYSSSSSEDEDESSSKKSRRMVVNTPKGSVTSGKQKNAPKKALPEDGIEAAPQSTQRSNVSSQRSQGETPISQFFHSPGKGQSESKNDSSILDGLPKKVRPSLSSLSDLASRGVPEVKEKAASLSPAPQVTRASGKVESDSEEDDSDENDGSDTESESSDSDSDDSDSASSGFISAKTAGSALGKKRKGGGGFASLLRDSQRR